MILDLQSPANLPPLHFLITGFTYLAQQFPGRIKSKTLMTNEP
jgi:hypothetical protein